MKPQNFEEKVVWYYLIGTYVLYFLGAQYVVAPIFAWGMLAYTGKRLWQQSDETPVEERIRVPVTVWIWIFGMALVAIALLVGHYTLDMGTTRTIKSFVNFFMRSWALLAIFPLIGCLNIRPQLLCRAICILALQTLVLIPIAYALGAAGVAMPLYVSTIMAKIGGTGLTYYSINLYTLGEGAPRLYLFAPWAPALAFVGCVHFFLATQETDKKWQWIGMLANAIAIWGSGSRLGLLCLVVLPIAKIVLANMIRPSMQIALGTASFVAGVFSYQLLTLADNFIIYFRSQRASSSRVRDVLQRMAYYQWKTDAPIWGHAIKAEKGPKVVQEMPIGSHHTWFGALYTHGIVGFLGLAIPMAVTFVVLLIKSQSSKLAQTALAVFLVFIAFSMGENIENLAYITWPGLVLLGMALKERVKFDFAKLG
ncbi:O-antigen ligase domain-containing protein [Oculatella sp. LEGE 06141]|uniref:O-antigen ligase family protein n=1 Tax=Oculatella sp. LEGE 06141 TaxID=1828648 RepID=UPI00188065A7|nr:O-antigen ligase domain-containing protein [Oculatella sp. LEGE 06141]MBE9178909.1 O-antigen ligase domain-containing protein [Oculatella sp. LEGE 06141]